MKKSCRKCAPKPNNPKQLLHVRNSVENKIFWNRIIKKFQKSYIILLLFLTQFLLMEKTNKNKRALNLWLDTLQVTKQIPGNFFISYILSDQFWWCNIKWFLSYPKNYICKFMRAHSELIHGIINYSIFICPFESGK